MLHFFHFSLFSLWSGITKIFGVYYREKKRRFSIANEWYKQKLTRKAVNLGLVPLQAIDPSIIGNRVSVQPKLCQTDTPGKTELQQTKAQEMFAC